jgi:uncharacterized protein YybS (DUF2232 family)
MVFAGLIGHRMTFFFPIPNTIYIFGHGVSLLSSMPNLPPKPLAFMVFAGLIGHRMTFFFPIPNTIYIFGHGVSLFSSMPNLHLESAYSHGIDRLDWA